MGLSFLVTIFALSLSFLTILTHAQVIYAHPLFINKRFLLLFMLTLLVRDILITKNIFKYTMQENMGITIDHAICFIQ